MSDTQNVHSTSPATAQGEDTMLVRLLFMVLFGFVGYFVFWASLFTAALQFIVTLVTGAANEDLKRGSAWLTGYLGDILGYVTFQNEDKPFPFNDQPGTDVTPTDN